MGGALHVPFTHLTRENLSHQGGYDVNEVQAEAVKALEEKVKAVSTAIEKLEVAYKELDLEVARFILTGKDVPPETRELTTKKQL